jgi:SAM-dependent methyltransferase
MDPRASIVGIDASAEMISVARANVHDPRARFEVGSAASADRLGGLFDRVTCNAAFWQFPASRAVFEALSRVTESGAGLAFDVPSNRVSGEPMTIHPFQVALIRAIEQEMGSALEVSPVTVDLLNLEAAGAEHGFTLRRIERHAYHGHQGELMELMSIPAMIEPLTPDLDTARRRSVLRRAFEASDPDEQVSVPWIFLSFERAGGT